MYLCIPAHPATAILGNCSIDAVEAHNCVDIVAKFTDEQYTTVNQSTLAFCVGGGEGGGRNEHDLYTVHVHAPDELVNVGVVHAWMIGKDSWNEVERHVGGPQAV